MEWTHKDIATLRKLHGTMPLSRIALILKRNKNAISGKCNRLGLRLSPTEQPNYRNRPNSGQFTTSPFAVNPSPNPRRVLFAEEQPTEHSVRINQLTATTCRFPQANQMFCARPTSDKHRSYCHEHHQRCIAPAFRTKDVG